MQTVPDEASVFGNKRWLGVNSGQSDDVVGAESDFFGAYRMLTGDLWMGAGLQCPGTIRVFRTSMFEASCARERNRPSQPRGERLWLVPENHR